MDKERRMWFEKKQSPDTPSGISIKSKPEDPPEFWRTYTAATETGVVIKVEIKNWTYSSDTYTTGVLTQPDGKWITFDVKRVADRIIDPVLLPAVEAVVKEILKIDAAFRKTKPTEFTDEKGVTWIRKVQP
jgi:hypothetical protein